MNVIGIIGAMELEVEELKSKMENESVKTVAGMDFHRGSLNGAQVVIVRSGVGKVNAALCVQILSDVFQVTHVINTGVAGSLNVDLDIGDFLISKDALQHDLDVTTFGYKPGVIPQMKESIFKADERLIRLASDTCKEVNPDVGIKIGRVVSGDQFVAGKEIRERLIRLFQGDCVEMEGAAIAHGAYLNNLPFVIIRVISDKADNSAEIVYPTFEKAAALHCAKLVGELVKRI